MKQIKTILTAFAVAALAFSCTKEIVVTEDFEAPGTVTVGFTADAINTKAVFGDKDGNAYPVFWSTNDVAPAVTVNYNKDFVQATDFSLSSDRRTANFKGAFSGLTGEQVFIAVTPYSSLKSVSSSDKRINVEIPSGQTNGNGSPDEDAIIGYAVSETFTATPEKVSLSFKHVTAYLHLTVANLSLASGEQVQSVDIISAKEISGRMFFYPETKATSSNSMLKVISVSTSQLADVWAGIAPVDLSGETVTFKVVTDQGTYSKDVTFGAGRTLTSGRVAKFTVDMAGVTREAFETFSLVTNASELHVGDEILIVGAKDDVALSAAQNANNRGVASVVIDGNKVIAPS
ncbi:MAG: fimbrillin family protein, partial [Bacteroidales bacterium]|nr:fimbrillin family protein [Bacteroidales bacterium]